MYIIQILKTIQEGETTQLIYKTKQAKRKQ